MTPTDTTNLMQEGHEETVVGFLLNFPDQLMAYGAILAPDLFTIPRNRMIFDTFVSLNDEGAEICTISVSDCLRRRGRLDETGGVAHLEHLANTYRIGATAFDYALDELRASAANRAVAQVGERMISGDLSPADALSQLQLAVQQGSEGGRGLTIRNAEEIRTMVLDEHDCLMGDRILAKGQSVVLAGASGLGKSRLLLQMAVACIGGRDWCGFTTHAKGLRWLILQTENSVRRLQSDIVSLHHWCGTSWDEVAESLFIHTLETDRDGILTLSDPRVVRCLDAAIQELKPNVIGIDPLRDLIMGDPNSDADMAATLAAIGAVCRRGNKQRAIVLLHHALTGKSGAAKASGYDRASFARNSKVLHGWTRGQINVAPGSSENNESLVLTCGKNSNGKEFAPLAVRLSPALIYEPDDLFDLEAWRDELSGSGKDARKRVFSPSAVKEVIGQTAVSKKDIVRALTDEIGCGSARAYELVKEAEQQGYIKRSRATKLYALAS